MNKDWKRMDWGFATIFIVWLALGGLVSALMPEPWWQSFAALGTWIIALGVFLAFWQYRQMKRSANAQLVIGLSQELGSKEQKGKLRSIYKLTPTAIQSLTNDDEDEIEEVLNRLDMLGVLVNHEVIDEGLAIEGYAGATVLRCWYQLHAYIHERRQSRDSNLYENLEDLASRTLKYAKNHRKKETWIKFASGDKREAIDLVAELTKTTDEYLKPKPFGKQAKSAK